MVSTTPAPASEGLIGRLQTFVTDNKRVVLIGAGVAAVGVGYYVYTSKNPAPSGSSRSVTDADAKGQAAAGSAEGDSATAKKKKSGKGSSKKKTTKDADGPLLEERKSKASSEEPADVPASPTLGPTEIAALSSSERTARAQSYKSRGNAAYQKRDFHRAEGLYTKAIIYASVPEAVYYSNRAACYMNLSPPQYEKVVADCDEALKLDRTYIKALNRRATALEALGRNGEALRDFTATTILEKFQNESTTQTLERCLKKMAVAQTEETLASREPHLPSHNFIKAYMLAFRPRPKPTLPPIPSQGDETLVLAYDALEATDFVHAFTLINEAVEQGISTPDGKAKALNLQGTFKFLIGDTRGARDDFQASLDIFPTYTQTWVKIASVQMEMGDPEKAFEAFDKAISYDERDPDIYYHRGQVHFIMQNYDAASEDYNKSTALDDTFVFSHIQYAVAQYKKNEAETAKASFRKSMQLFPDSSDVLNYYGELLLDLQRYPDAIEKFDRASEIEKNKKPPMNVLPYVNKALATYQWKQDIVAAQKLCQDAIDIDPECDAAIATIAQLYLQTSQLDEALEMFRRHAKIARTGNELEQCYTFEFATVAQQEFAKNYPTQAKELEQMAKAMNAMQAASSS